MSSSIGRFPDSKLCALIRRGLLAWYDRNRRPLPWREHPTSAYHQWVAEIMLQQTQVATVEPYYHDFVKRFPNVKALADANQDDVLRLWAGLGYYARARNLHRAAQYIIKQFDGEFPDTVTGLQKLPGVGRYTAGAIASIAFDRRAPILDGNVKRVLSRLFGIDGDPKSNAVIADLWELAERILPKTRCGDFNQAVMDLGAMICLPAQPRCQECPLRKECFALTHEKTAELPRASARAKVSRVDYVVAVLCHNGRFLFRRRESQGLWGGMWEMPSRALSSPPETRHELKHLLVESPFGKHLKTSLFQFLGVVDHRLTHRQVFFHIYYYMLQEPDGPPRTLRHHRWVELRRLGTLALGKAQQKVLNKVLSTYESSVDAA